MGVKIRGLAEMMASAAIVLILLAVATWPAQPASYEISKDAEPHDSLDPDPEDDVPYEVVIPQGLTENLGQVDEPDVVFQLSTDTGKVSLLGSEVRFDLVGRTSTSCISMTFPGSTVVMPEGKNPLPGATNYLLGSDPTGWVRGATTYSAAIYRDLYEDIDLLVGPEDNGLKYEFWVRPGGDPDDIEIRCSGQDAMTVGPDGSVVVSTSAGDLVDLPPMAFPEGMPHNKVDCSFELMGPDSYGFAVGRYDPTRTLVIDPVIFSTLIGGAGNESVNALALDPNGYIYLTGRTSSPDYPTTPGCLNSTINYSGGFVSKLDPTGSELVWSTFLGGSRGATINDIAVDFLGFVHVVGATYSPDLPTTENAWQREPLNKMASNAFAGKLSRDGSSLVYSTYLSGSDSDAAKGVVVDGDGNMIITGDTWSRDIPVTGNPLQPWYGGGWRDGFVAKVDPDDGYVHFFTFLGGNKDDAGSAVTVDKEGFIYITGNTWSRNFPVTQDAAQHQYGGDQSDAFIAKMRPDGTDLVWATYLGGGDRDRGYHIDIDTDRNVYVSGITDSVNLPTTQDAFITEFEEGPTSFACKLRHDGTRFEYVTYIGGNGWDWVEGQALYEDGCLLIATTTSSDDLPLTDASYRGSPLDSVDIFLVKLDPSGIDAVYSTLIGTDDYEEGGGLVLHRDGTVVVAGTTMSMDIQTTQGAYQRTSEGEREVFVTQLEELPDDPDVDPYATMWFWRNLLLGLVVILIVLVLGLIASRREFAEAGA